MEATAPVGEAEPGKKPFMDRMLDWIEKAGNKVPHPAIIFVGLVVFIVLLSQLLDWLNISVTYEVAQQEPTTVVEELDLTGTDAPELFPIEHYREAEFVIETQTTEVQGSLPSMASDSCSRSSCLTSPDSRLSPSSSSP
jgi:hypothetical protein